MRQRSKDQESSYQLSNTASGAGTSVSSKGVVVSDKGEMISYDRNAYKDAHLMMRKQKPQASFSALQVRTELDSAAFDASRTGTHFYAAAQPAGEGHLAIGN